MTKTLKTDDFWNRLENVTAGMLTLGAARAVPMSHYVDREADALWFISAQGTSAVKALATGPAPAQYQIASGDGQIYARIDGEASLSSDSAKLDEIWNAVADSWFEDGRRDDDVRLIRVALTEAEVWTTPGKIGFLYEIAKAQTRDETPDMGEHGRLTFAG
jgi:general stress protein 26